MNPEGIRDSIIDPKCRGYEGLFFYSHRMIQRRIRFMKREP